MRLFSKSLITSDIQQWSESTTYNGHSLISSCYTNNGVFAALADNGTYQKIATSSGGLIYGNFTTTALYYNFEKIIYAFNKIYAYCNDSNGYGYVYSSADGESWTKLLTTSRYYTINNIVSGNSQILVYANGKIYHTEDGVNFSGYSSVTNWKTALKYINNLYVGTSGYSSNGYSYTTITLPQPANEQISWEDVTYGNGKYVFIGLSANLGWVTTSTNLNTFTTPENISDIALRKIDFYNKEFCAIGYKDMNATDGVIITSRDLLSYKEYKRPMSLYSIASGNGRFSITGAKRDNSQTHPIGAASLRKIII